MRIFFLVFVALWSAVHYYVGIRIIPPARLSRPFSALAWIVVALFATPVPLTLLFWRSPSIPPWFAGFQSFAFLTMGILGILLPLLVLRDLGWSGLKALDWLAKAMRRTANRDQHPNTWDILPSDPDRRMFLLHSANIGILGISGTLAGIGFHGAEQTPAVVDVPVMIPGLPSEWEGYTIAQISDIHVGPSIKREYVEAIVARVNESRPDIVAITGDLVDGFVNDLRTDVGPIGDLVAPDGVFFATGNHEYFWDLAGWLAELRRMGVIVLLNEHRVIPRNRRKIVIAGVADYSAARHGGGHESDPKAAIHGAPDADARILLAHQPRSIFAAADLGFDLQLSGHTHGGQFYPWVFFVPLQQPYVAGLHRHGNTWVYVNRGAGYWGPPVRLGAPSEIALVRLTGQFAVVRSQPRITSRRTAPV